MSFHGLAGAAPGPRRPRAESGSPDHPTLAGKEARQTLSTTHAGKATATLATWYVADLEQVVDELAASGVTFERYDEPPLTTDEKGIASTGAGKVAWFKDPDGNTFAVEQ